MGHDRRHGVLTGAVAEAVGGAGRGRAQLPARLPRRCPASRAGCSRARRSRRDRDEHGNRIRTRQGDGEPLGRLVEHVEEFGCSTAAAPSGRLEVGRPASPQTGPGSAKPSIAISSTCSLGRSRESEEGQVCRDWRRTGCGGFGELVEEVVLGPTPVGVALLLVDVQVVVEQVRGPVIRGSRHRVSDERPGVQVVAVDEPHLERVVQRATSTDVIGERELTGYAVAVVHLGNQEAGGPGTRRGRTGRSLNAHQALSASCRGACGRAGRWRVATCPQLDEARGRCCSMVRSIRTPSLAVIGPILGPVSSVVAPLLLFGTHGPTVVGAVCAA